MKIIFAIPTWNRCEQLDTTIRILTKQIVDSKVNAEIVVSNNCSIDSTQTILEKLANEFNFVHFKTLDAHISGGENFQEVFSLALSLSNQGDYIWFFGDDDDLNAGALRFIFDSLKESQPFFASAGNTRLKPHTNKIYQSGMTDIVQKFSFFLTSSFISQCIFSYELLTKITEGNLFSEKFCYDAYSHGSSVLWLGYNQKCLYIDFPICTYRAYQGQEQETRERWAVIENNGKYKGSTYMGIFNFIDSVMLFMNEGILPKKLDRYFFRYWTFHFWDFLLYEATVMGIQNSSTLNGEHWNKITNLSSMLEDKELAKRILMNVDLQRTILASGVSPALIMNITKKYTFWGGAVYDLPVISTALLQSLTFAPKDLI
jgi:glycosyltransferase involved in cell wall biosynthesis